MKRKWGQAAALWGTEPRLRKDDILSFRSKINCLQWNTVPSMIWRKNPGFWLNPGFSSVLCRKQLFVKTGECPAGVRRGLVGRGAHALLGEKLGTGQIMAWHQGWERDGHSSGWKRKKIRVILRQAVRLKAGISQFMNAGFHNSKCRLLQVLCVILFVCVVVVLKEPSHDYGFFMQIGRQTLFQRVRTVRFGACQTLHARVVPF